MNCTICKKPIVLIPSAIERAKKFGGKPSDYTRLFTTHGICQAEKNTRESRELAIKYRDGLVAGKTI